MAGFYYDYSNMQVKTVLVGVTLIENAASSRIYGFDGDFTIHVTDGFSLSGGVGLQNGRFTDYKNAQFITADGIKIGIASCRERVCQYVSITAVAESLKKK